MTCPCYEWQKQDQSQVCPGHVVICSLMPKTVLGQALQGVAVNPSAAMGKADECLCLSA